MKDTLIPCKACGKDIAAKAKTCPHCGAKNSKSLFKKWWFWTIAAVIFIGVISSSNTESTPSVTNPNISPTEQNNTVSAETKTSAFSGDCGISATAEMGTDIIGQPTVTVSITNISGKDISAIQFYAVPLDVYGEELKGIFAQNNLYTDDLIAANSSESCSWQFLDDKVKTIQLYVYSVYFSDGTEWGDKDATKSVILKSGLQIEVNGASGN